MPAPPSPELLALGAIEEADTDPEGKIAPAITLSENEIPASSPLPSGIYEAQPPAPVLVQEYREIDLLERAGSFDAVPIVINDLSDLRGLPLDPKAVYLLGTMDGMTSLEMLLDVSPMPRAEVLSAICLLFDHGVIGF